MRGSRTQGRGAPGRMSLGLDVLLPARTNEVWTRKSNLGLGAPKLSGRVLKWALRISEIRPDTVGETFARQTFAYIFH